MKLRFLAVVAGLVMVAGVARAQVGVYVAPIFSRVSNPADTGVFAFLGDGTTSRVFGGVGFGFYDDYHHSGKWTVGGDVRATFLHGNNAPLGSFLLGPRVTYRPDTTLYRPYFQVIGGVGSSTAPHNPKGVSKPEVQVLAGLERAIGKHADWRVIEVGYGIVQTMNSSIVAQTNDFPASRQILFSTGIVFRFGGPKVQP
jgi:hypothetical protein